MQSTFVREFKKILNASSDKYEKICRQSFAYVADKLLCLISASVCVLSTMIFDRYARRDKSKHIFYTGLGSQGHFLLSQK